MFKKILFYQYSELLDKAISKNFDMIYESGDAMDGGGFELAMCKYYMTLQEAFNENNELLDKEAFSSKLEAFNFDFEDDFLSALETGMSAQPMNVNEFKDLFIKDKDRDKSVVVIKSYFMRYMHEKGFEFYLSGWLWDKMLNYWNRNNSNETTDTFFMIEETSFSRFLADFSYDFFIDSRSEISAVLWGSVYIYEFLNKYNIVSDNDFNNFIELSRKLKGNIIGQSIPDLWNLNFVHYWQKPECISEAEFFEEKNIFEKSISLKRQNFTRLRSEISEELSKIGELSEFIIEGGIREYG
jgi:hypothetical protein